jgi:DNA-binding NtrC family response regulator
LPGEIRGAGEAVMPAGGEGAVNVGIPVNSATTEDSAPEPRAAATSGTGLDVAFDAVFEALKNEESILDRVERELIARALKADDGDEAKAAKRLGLTKSALQRRLKEI